MSTGSALATQETKIDPKDTACAAVKAALGGQRKVLARDYALVLVGWAFGEVGWPYGEPTVRIRRIVSEAVLMGVRRACTGTQRPDANVVTRCSILTPKK